MSDQSRARLSRFPRSLSAAICLGIFGLLITMAAGCARSDSTTYTYLARGSFHLVEFQLNSTKNPTGGSLALYTLDPSGTVVKRAFPIQMSPVNGHVQAVIGSPPCATFILDVDDRVVRILAVNGQGVPGSRVFPKVSNTDELTFQREFIEGSRADQKVMGPSSYTRGEVEEMSYLYGPCWKTQA